MCRGDHSTGFMHKVWADYWGILCLARALAYVGGGHHCIPHQPRLGLPLGQGAWGRPPFLQSQHQQDVYCMMVLQRCRLVLWHDELH